MFKIHLSKYYDEEIYFWLQNNFCFCYTNIDNRTSISSSACSTYVVPYNKAWIYRSKGKSLLNAGINENTNLITFAQYHTFETDFFKEKNKNTGECI